MNSQGGGYGTTTSSIKYQNNAILANENTKYSKLIYCMCMFMFSIFIIYINSIY